MHPYGCPNYSISQLRLGMFGFYCPSSGFVIPAKAGIHSPHHPDARFRGHDGIRHLIPVGSTDLKAES